MIKFFLMKFIDSGLKMLPDLGGKKPEIGYIQYRPIESGSILNDDQNTPLVTQIDYGKWFPFQSNGPVIGELLQAADLGIIQDKRVIAQTQFTVHDSGDVSRTDCTQRFNPQTGQRVEIEFTQHGIIGYYAITP